MSPPRGSHITLEEPDVAYWHIAGDVTGDDIRKIYAIQVEFCKNKRFVFVLADISEIRSITAEARKLSAEGPNQRAVSMPIRGNAIVGASFHFRVIGTLVAKAAQFIHKSQDNPTRFFENEADARAWFAQRRIEIADSSLPGK